MTAGAFRRRGEVRAHRLAAPRTWTTTAGDRLQGDAGDWWVVGPDGSGRSVKDEQFRRSYEHLGEDRYRRTGVVTARQVEVPEVVATLEGRATAAPGMWVVTGPGGDSWPVPDDEFRRGYEPIEE